MLARVRQRFDRNSDTDLRDRYGDVAPTPAIFEELQRRYSELRDEFIGDPRVEQELIAWRAQQENFEYKLLKGLMSDGPTGKKDALGGAWKATDTFFSEYKLHNQREKILSETSRSYIIGNAASYDSRQYPHDSARAGQGFGHCLVIPKKRIYNIVDPEATAVHCSVIREMRSHFVDFWTDRNGGKKIILDSAGQGISHRDRELQASELDSASVDAIREDASDYYDAVKEEFLKLAPNDFLFGFHPHPSHSVGHLHMHVFPHGEKFRKFSTKKHDHKTIPMQAVLKVEGQRNFWSKAWEWLVIAPR